MPLHYGSAQDVATGGAAESGELEAFPAYRDYGDKNLYKEQYRKAFIRGYEDAFNRR